MTLKSTMMWVTVQIVKGIIVEWLSMKSIVFLRFLQILYIEVKWYKNLSVHKCRLFKSWSIVNWIIRKTSEDFQKKTSENKSVCRAYSNHDNSHMRLFGYHANGAITWHWMILSNIYRQLMTIYGTPMMVSTTHNAVDIVGTLP